MKDIESLELEQLQIALAPFCSQKFRSNQIFQWLHKRNCADFDQMSNISAQIKQDLKHNFYINHIKISKKLVSAIDDTVKYLYELSDGETIETVFMKYHHGNSVCISTQAGCKMGCSFCASTKAGFVRNLTVSEMLDQVYQTEQDTGEKISNIVLMGIGEPLDNYSNVLAFLHVISHPEGHNIGMRHITISTCGIVPKIYDLADEKLQLTLAISLHAPDDWKRSETMPVNKRYPIDPLLKACKYYTQQTNRRITFEYALMRGKNDSAQQAKELAEKLRGLLCHVNLIPINEIKEERYQASTHNSITEFSILLKQYGVHATARRTLGQDINAACGQLRRNNTSLQSK